MDSFFKISERGSTVAQEIRGGFVTFFTMAYIIVLNPLILGFAKDADGKFLPEPQHHHVEMERIHSRQRYVWPGRPWQHAAHGAPVLDGMGFQGSISHSLTERADKVTYINNPQFLIPRKKAA